MLYHYWSIQLEQVIQDDLYFHLTSVIMRMMYVVINCSNPNIDNVKVWLISYSIKPNFFSLWKE